MRFYGLFGLDKVNSGAIVYICGVQCISVCCVVVTQWSLACFEVLVN